MSSKYERITFVARCLNLTEEYVEKCSRRMYESVRKNCRDSAGFKWFTKSRLFIDFWMALERVGAAEDNSLFVTIFPKYGKKTYSVADKDYVIVDSRLSNLITMIRRNNSRLTWVYYKKERFDKTACGWRVDAPLTPAGRVRRNMNLAKFKFKYQAIDYRWCCIFYLYPEILRTELLASVYEATGVDEEEQWSGTLVDVHADMDRMLIAREECYRMDERYGYVRRTRKLKR